MNYLTILVTFLSLTTFITAQKETITKEFSIGSAEKLKLESDYGDVHIKIWNQRNVKVEASVMVNGKNEIQAFEIEGRQRGSNGYIIESEVNFDDIEKMISVKDKNGNWEMYSSEDYEDKEGEKHYGLNYGYKSDITITYWIPQDIALITEMTYGDITIEKATSQTLELHSTYGDVEADFTSSNTLPQMELNSTYGAVDLTLDKRVKANLEMHTSYGEILTNFDLDYKNGRRGNNTFGEDITSTLNGGGQGLILEATYGKVYLRKSE